MKYLGWQFLPWSRRARRYATPEHDEFSCGVRLENWIFPYVAMRAVARRLADVQEGR